MEYLETLKDFFKDKDYVIMAFLFGSAAKGKQTKESDIDIAVYLKHYDESLVYSLWNQLEDLFKRDVDLIILNNANATIAWEAIRGQKIVINDKQLYINYMLDVSREAEDLRKVVYDIYKMRQERRANYAK